MCGIVGYVGPKPTVSVLMEGLASLEYRGYDSAGVAVLTDDGLSVVRRMGKQINQDFGEDMWKAIAHEPYAQFVNTPIRSSETP